MELLQVNGDPHVLLTVILRCRYPQTLSEACWVGIRSQAPIDWHYPSPGADRAPGPRL